MEDIAKIGFQADTSQLSKAEQELNKLEPAAKKAETAADKLGKQLNGFGGTLSAFNSKLNVSKGALGEFSKGFIAAFGIGAATFGLSSIIGTLADFEYEMATVAAVSGATGAELQALRDTAKEMGATTEFSATQAATGLKLLVQAGYSSRDAMATLPAILNLATTEAMDLGVATEYVNSIMAGFGLGVQDAAKVTDILVYASNAASTGVAELGEGMKYVGPISAALGISIEDTAAALGILSDAGLKGGQAGTALRASLAALASPSKMAADEIKRLGLSLDDVNPATNSITDIVDKFAGKSLDAAAAIKIFGREAAPAFLGLIANKDKLAQVTAEMQNVAGEAQRIADYMRDNFKGSLQNLSSAVEAVIIAMGDAGLTAVLRGVVDILTFVVSGIATVVTAFSNWVTSSTPVVAITKVIGDNLNLLIGLVTAAALVYTATFIPAIYGATAALVAQAATYYVVNGGLAGMAAAALAATGAFITLKSAMIATGVGALIVGLGLVIAKIIEVKNELGSWAATFNFVVGVADYTWNRIIAGAQIMYNNVKIWFKNLDIAFTQGVMSMQRKWANFVGDIAASARELPGDLAGAIGSVAGAWQLQIENAISSSAHAVAETKREIESLEDTNKNLKIAPLDFGQLKKDAWLATTDLNKFNVALDVVTKTAEKVTTDGIGPVSDDLGDLGDKAGGAAEKTQELKTALQSLTEEFQKLTEPFDQASQAFDALEKAKELGILSNDQYAASLERIHEAFLKTGGTSEQWQKIMSKNTESVGSQLEELGKKNITDLGKSFADLAVDGSANFADLAKNIIKELIAIAWQALIVKPLLSWMGFADGGTFGTGDALTGALNNAGVGAVQPSAFAKGGTFSNSVVNAPTAFKFAQGDGFGLGVMGEAGPEAVMPLTRGPDGSLGVQMYGGTGSQRTAESQRVAVDVNVTAEEGEMFRPVVKAIAKDQANNAVMQGMQEMNSQLPDRVEQIINDPRLKGV